MTKEDLIPTKKQQFLDKIIFLNNKLNNLVKINFQIL